MENTKTENTPLLYVANVPGTGWIIQVRMGATWDQCKNHNEALEEIDRGVNRVREYEIEQGRDIHHGPVHVLILKERADVARCL